MSLLEFLIGHCLGVRLELMLDDLLLPPDAQTLDGNVALGQRLPRPLPPDVSLADQIKMGHQIQINLVVVEGPELPEEPRLVGDVNIVHDVVAGHISPGAVVPLIVSVCIVFLLLVFIIFTPEQLWVQKRVAIVNELVISPLTVLVRRYIYTFLICSRPMFAILRLILLDRQIHGYLMICKVF